MTGQPRMLLADRRLGTVERRPLSHGERARAREVRSAAIRVRSAEEAARWPREGQRSCACARRVQGVQDRCDAEVRLTGRADAGPAEPVPRVGDRNDQIRVSAIVIGDVPPPFVGRIEAHGQCRVAVRVPGRRMRSPAGVNSNMTLTAAPERSG